MRLITNALLAAALFAGCAPHDISDGTAVTAAAVTAAPAGDAPSAGDAPVTATTPTLALLAARRPFVHFPTYTPEQRQLVADEAQLLFRDFYVHRDEKISYYGPWVDPLPRLAWLTANAKTIADDRFHLTLQNIFETVRDLHQNYYFPYPYACYSSQLPLSFTAIADSRLGALLPLVAVEAKSSSAAMLALVPQLAQIGVGDVLVSYDGLPALLAVAALVPFSDGANASGATTRAVQLLTFRSQLMTPVPARDSARLTLQRPDGSRYDIELPWVSQVRAACAAGVPGSPSVAEGSALDVGSDPYQLEYERTYELKKHDAGTIALTPSAEPILSYGKTTTAAGTFGYITLTSFSPVALTVAQTIDEFARILRDELRATDGVIIDVRNNGGGFIGLAEQLPQLFGANPVAVEGFRLLNSEGNATLINGSSAFAGTDWQTIINEARGTSARFTRTAQFTSNAAANARTQVYFKPVAVLTNARCFSACDMFTAAVQDNGAARIWGEELKTGAGGANVVTDAFFRGSVPAGQPNPFPALPGGQQMRVAWRQAVRAGKNAGRLLEDHGVTRDDSATRIKDDLLHAGQSQLDRLTRDLAARARKSRGSIYLQQPGATSIAAGDSIAFAATVADTDSVEFVLDGQVVERSRISVGPAQLVRLDSGVRAGEPRFYDFELRGLRNGVRVWRAFATARTEAPYLALPADGLSLDFDGGSSAPLALYARGKDAGWIVHDGALTTTRGATYADLTWSDAVLFVDASDRSSLTLSLHAQIATELDFDYFTIYALVDGQRTVLEEFTGDVGERALTYDLSAFAGKRVQIGFQFTSDELINTSGVFIDQVTLR